MAQHGDSPAVPGPATASSTAGEVFRVFLRLGLTSFGGPVAHIGYFREEFVTRRRWLDGRAYADLVALCQFLPGPASTQIGMGIGLARAGLPGGLAAWIGFTAPSALLLILAAFGVAALEGAVGQGMLRGLKVVAVAVVAQAVWGMARTLCPDAARMTVAVLAAAVLLAVPVPLGQIAVIAAGGLIGWALLPAPPEASHAAMPVPISRALGLASLALFVLLLAGLPVLAELRPGHAVALVDSFYRSGSLVFGGGHVVLPLLQAEVVPPGWVSNDAFLAGYGAAQAVPGPLLSFAAYLGAVAGPSPNGWFGGFLALVAVFLPSFLLILGGLPFWESLRRHQAMRSALRGINAAVVGLLLAALYHPVWTSAILGPGDFALGLAAFLLLVFWKIPSWAVVLLSGAAGAGLALLPPLPWI